VSFLGERHEGGPPGLAGGSAGRPGRLLRQRRGSEERLPAKATFVLDPGEILVVETPGGGGHGKG
jgi:N-methylhydantoinase B